jgi:acetylornithine deacetylase/succinyl-diaminopimelate desuccinylase-like protein
MEHHDNAITALAEAVARVGRHEFPIDLTPAVRTFLEDTAAALQVEFDPADPEALIAKLGPIANIIGATIRNTANPTMFDAGYKGNVIPGSATAIVDCRTLPGRRESFLAELREIVGPDIEVAPSLVQLPALETGFDGDLVDAMDAALRAEDPGARTVPYLMFGGTDAVEFAKLGMRCFGFVPLRIPPDLNFSALFHGVDERVPVEGLKFGARVLDHLLRLS